MRKLLWELLAGSKGGVNRARIIAKLKKRPYNANQLAEILSLNYKTIKYHIEVLEKNDIVVSAGKGYGILYFLSDKMEENFDIFMQVVEEFRGSDTPIYYVGDKMVDNIPVELIH
ncbi:MAG: winged helix-turn-helix domain-containing protein [Methanobacterium sp.]|jgi:DNA-binding transcriptional ArsR family regulator|nr:winged helix-turn-helix domain-containing protein [Methanobacterium sp.]